MMSEHKAFHALLEQRDVEIHQKTDVAARQPDIVEKLGLMNVEKHINRFYRHDNELLNERTDAIARVQMYRIILQRHQRLLLNMRAARPWLMSETMLVGGFEESWTKGAMRLQACVHHDAREGFRP